MSRPGPVSVWLSACRPKTLPAAAVPVLVGSAEAWRLGGFDPLPAAICLGFALLMQIGVNFANDAWDHEKGADMAERTGPRRAVASGWVSGRTMKRAAFGVLALGFCLGLTLTAWGGPWLIAVGIASVLGALAYTAGPFPLAYRGWGDVFVILFFGLIAVGFTTYVQTGDFAGSAWLLGLAIGLLANNILVVNNLRDIESDARVGKRTLAVRLGRTGSLLQYQLSVTIACLVPVALYLQTGAWPVVLAAFVYPFGRYQGLALARARTPDAYSRMLARTSLLLVMFGLLASAGLVLSRPA
ncbi:MAG: 1,4-dihydroxy-2-naphthoate polyprenyltransferase [Opitutales bacterium]